MIKIGNILNLENKKLFIRYILISLISYSIVFIGLYILVDVLNAGKTISFMLVYGFTYIYLYVVQLKFLFKTKHNTFKLIRFYLSVLFFYIVANILFNTALKLNVHYLLSSIISIVILMPFRLIVSKLFVFKD